jgi:polysaccharide export outer membrane protein
VLVLGEVAKPGSYEIHGEMRLLDAISQAGGPTPKAELRRATLARPGVAGTRSLDLEPLLAGKEATNPEFNLLLQPGDTLVLPETQQQVYVLGSVARPDLYPIRPGDRILDAFTRSGGTTAGDISRAVLVRRDMDGQPVARHLDLRKMMTKADMSENELLQPGDVLFVPDKKQPRRNILETILPLTTLFNLFRY